VAARKPPPREAREVGVVVDASVILKLVLPEDGSEEVGRLWRQWAEQDTEIAAPFLLAYEVTSVLRNKVFRGELSPEAGEAAFVASRAQEVALRHPEGIRKEPGGLRRPGTSPRATTRLTSHSPNCWTVNSGRRIAGWTRTFERRCRDCGSSPADLSM